MAGPAQATMTSASKAVPPAVPTVDGAGSFPERRDAVRGAELEAARLAQRPQAQLGGQHARVGLDQHHPRGGDPGEAPGRGRGRDLLDGCAGGLQRAGDGVQGGLVAQRQLAGDVQELSPRRRLEVVPARAGEQGHLDVVGLGVAETEDPRVALGAGARVTRCPRCLQDDHAPAPPGQGPRGGEAEETGSDDDATAVIGHDADHRNTPCRTSLDLVRTSFGRGPAVRSASVTSGMDVSTHPAAGPVTADPGHHGDAEPPPGAEDLPPAALPEDHGRSQQVLRTIGFHVVALALLHRARRRPVVARLVGASVGGADVRVRRSGAGGLVHGLARLGDRPSRTTWCSRER